MDPTPLSQRPLFQLSPRLALCARLVREGKPLADVGTDHGYLPIWLLRRGKIPRAVASDLRPGPLEAARRHARIYGVGEELALVQGDGLSPIAPEDGENVVIAGMGGELILRIVKAAPWLRDPEKRLILQPMSAASKLRRGLYTLGFQVDQEYAVEDGGKVYSAFSALYQEECPRPGPLYPYMGALRPGEKAVELYARRVLGDLGNQRKGAVHRGDELAQRELEERMEEIRKQYLEE